MFKLFLFTVCVLAVSRCLITKLTFQERKKVLEVILDRVNEIAAHDGFKRRLSYELRDAIGFQAACFSIKCEECLKTVASPVR